MEEHSQKKKSRKNLEKEPENNGLSNYAKYTGLGVQMIAIILLSVWGGTKLDKLLN
jgi:hypothetical protein